MGLLSNWVADAPGTRWHPGREREVVRRRKKRKASPKPKRKTTSTKPVKLISELKKLIKLLEKL